jgi:ProP effector
MLSKAKFEGIKAVVALLCTRFPHCLMILPTSRRPLAIGIHHKLVEALDGTVSVDHVKRALAALYCGNIDYIRAGARPGAMRVDLDGNPAGPVTESERANYIKQIEAREARLAAKKAEQAAARVSDGVNVKDTVVTATTTAPTMSAPLQPLKPPAGLAALKAAGSARRKALESA